VANQEKLISLVQQRYTGDTALYTLKKENKKPEKVLKKTSEEKKQELEENTKINETEKEYKQALAYIKDLVSPAFMKIQPNKIKINNTYAKTFFVYAYPSFLE